MTPAPRLCVLFLLLAGPHAHSRQEPLNDLIAKMQEKFESRSLSISISGSLTYKAPVERDDVVLTYEGKIQLKRGNKFLVAMTDTVGGSQKTSEFRSDGKRLVISRGSSKETREAKEGMAAVITAALARGSWMMVRDALRNPSLPEAVELLPVSDARLTGTEKLGDTEVRVLAYTLTFEKKPWKVTAWIDPKSLVPIKRRALLEGETPVVLIESYDQISVADLDDKLFSHE